MENVKFEINVSKKDLSNFMIYHNYHSMQGVIGVIISIGAFILLIFRFDMLDMMQKGLLAVLALAFTVITPVMLYIKAGNQEKRNPSFGRPITYELTDQGFSLSQGEEHVDIEWTSVYKVVDTGRSVIVYISLVRAFIWPKDQMGSQYKDIMTVLKSHVDSRKMKMKKA